MEGYPCAADRRAAHAAVGLEDVAVEPHGALAEGVEVDLTPVEKEEIR